MIIKYRGLSYFLKSKNMNEFYKKQIEYEFEHLCLDSHWLRQCFLNIISKNVHNYFDTNVNNLKYKEIHSKFTVNFV